MLCSSLTNSVACFSSSSNGNRNAPLQQISKLESRFVCSALFDFFAIAAACIVFSHMSHMSCVLCRCIYQEEQGQSADAKVNWFRQHGHNGAAFEKPGRRD